MASAAHTIDDHAHSGISPELVLVDPDLANRVRPRIPLLFLRRRPPLPVLRLVRNSSDEASVDERAASLD
jgi:hypothetical protein